MPTRIGEFCSGNQSRRLPRAVTPAGSRLSVGESVGPGSRGYSVVDLGTRQQELLHQPFFGIYTGNTFFSQAILTNFKKMLRGAVKDEFDSF